MTALSSPPGSVTYERDGRIAYITLRRPAKRNAVSLAMERELHEALARFDFDDDAWVAIISGQGSDFSVGADINERFDEPAEARDRRMSIGPETDSYLARSANWKPVIGAVQGWCVGLGFNLALECDLLVATHGAKFMVAEAKRGIPSGQLWAKMQTFMPSKVVTEMVLLGRPLAASEAKELGLINQVVAGNDPLPDAIDLASELLKLPPLAVRAHVRVTRWQWKRPTDESALYLQALKLHLTEDFEESTRAFIEKRPPDYRAR